MPDLIAQGPKPENRWRRKLSEEEKCVLGRASATWSVPWDDHISRRHAEISFHGGQLTVRRLSTARNPIYLRGQEATRFRLTPGEQFVIGNTTFTLVDEIVDVSIEAPEPIQEKSFSAQYLRKVRYRDADQRIEVLSRLPDVIAGAATENELFVQLVSMLLVGIPRADAVALVSVATPVTPESNVNVLHWDQRRAEGGRLRPSERLILESIRRDQSVLHVWEASATTSAQPFTVVENADWAFCTPVPGESSDGWGLYVTGRFAPGPPGSGAPSDPSDLRDELKFTEMVAAVLRSLLQLRNLQRQYAGMTQFFAPAVLEAVAGDDPQKVLAPREAEVSVMFCDLRGFSRESEKYADDLMGLLERISGALGVMTYHILDQGGVVGDFQGDAAMGFWGWPLGHTDIVERACRAALAIRAEFEATAKRADDPLADFRMGIGIATGRAVAGRIGTVDQVKVTVFGPVVNLASRLEGMTKIFRAPILLDDTTAKAVSEKLGPDQARLRRVAEVKPYGMDTSLGISELLPPVDTLPELKDEDLAAYQRALDAFSAGQWADAFDLLHKVPPNDRVKDFLTVYIAQHNRTPPADWNGVIEMESKS